MPEPAPTVGRIVHYVSYGTPGGEYTSQCRAAIVTEVPAHLVEEPYDGCPNDGTHQPWIIGVCVLNPAGMFFDRDLLQDEADHASGTWHWPERG